MLVFDAHAVRTVEFGVVRLVSGDGDFVSVPTGPDVQNELVSMAITTIEALRQRRDSRALFDAADKHAATEYLFAPIDDEVAFPLRDLHRAENLDIDSYVLDDMASVSAYFARLTNSVGDRITAVRRASQFKGLQKRSIMSFVDDSLQIIKQRVFQLNDDFDVIVDDDDVHILHPSGFRVLARVDDAVRRAVGKNLAHVSGQIPYVDWSAVQEYAETRPRAANLLASIRTHGYAEGVDRGHLLSLCQRTGVDVSCSSGAIVVPKEGVMGFLEVLDRRRYEVGLVKTTPEQFKAASRQRLAT